MSKFITHCPSTLRIPNDTAQSPPCLLVLVIVHRITYAFCTEHSSSREPEPHDSCLACPTVTCSATQAPSWIKLHTITQPPTRTCTSAPLHAELSDAWPHLSSTFASTFASTSQPRLPPHFSRPAARLDRHLFPPKSRLRRERRACSSLDCTHASQLLSALVRSAQSLPADSSWSLGRRVTPAQCSTLV